MSGKKLADKYASALPEITDYTLKRIEHLIEQIQDRETELVRVKEDIWAYQDYVTRFENQVLNMRSNNLDLENRNTQLKTNIEELKCKIDRTDYCINYLEAREWKRCGRRGIYRNIDKIIRQYEGQTAAPEPTPRSTSGKCEEKEERPETQLSEMTTSSESMESVNFFVEFNAYKDELRHEICILC